MQTSSSTAIPSDDCSISRGTATGVFPIASSFRLHGDGRDFPRSCGHEVEEIPSEATVVAVRIPGGLSDGIDSCLRRRNRVKLPARKNAAAKRLAPTDRMRPKTAAQGALAADAPDAQLDGAVQSSVAFAAAPLAAQALHGEGSSGNPFLDPIDGDLRGLGVAWVTAPESSSCCHSNAKWMGFRKHRLGRGGFRGDLFLNLFLVA